VFLIDTDILSELRKRDRNPGVVRWISQRTASDLYLSVVTLGEIQRGISQQEIKNPAFARQLAAWLDGLLNLYSERILAIDTSVARRWGRLTASVGHSGADIWIAATALQHGLTVATRNQRDYLPTGVALVDPFSA
jgi:predicted nucleic acid-binding protein